MLRPSSPNMGGQPRRIDNGSAGLRPRAAALEVNALRVLACVWAAVRRHPKNRELKRIEAKSCEPTKRTAVILQVKPGRWSNYAFIYLEFFP